MIICYHVEAVQGPDMCKMMTCLNNVAPTLFMDNDLMNVN